MTGEKKGFTLVEVIVVLVILAILAAIMIPAMTGWIDKSKEKQLIVACRTCVLAAQTLASESYSVNGTNTPPDGNAVIALSGVKGSASNISLDATSAAVDTLTYSDGTESMTYTRMPTPQYTIGVGLAREISEASNWARNYKPYKDAEEFLTMDYGKKTNPPPTPLSDTQLKSIFGELSLQEGPYYIYPMAIYGTNGKPLNIQYVTQQNPKDSSGQNRYVANAFIIEGKTYIAKDKKNGNVKGEVGSSGTSFQYLMNYQTFASEQAFVKYITESPGALYKEAQ